MVSKALLKQTKQLHLKKFRNERKSFIVEGDKLLLELLNSNFKVVHLFVTKEWHQTNITTKGRFDVHEVTDNELAEISAMESPNSGLAVVEIPLQEKVLITPGNNYLALDGIRDPGNMGTLLRIADWFGISGIFCSEDTVETFNPKVVQASMGSIFRVPVLTVDLIKLLSDMDSNSGIYGAMLNGESLYRTAVSKGWTLVIGNESSGIRKDLVPFIKNRITIPFYGPADERPESLNAAVAASVICAEFCRQQA
ncbi:MAG: RNA methyltransferase [Bacteroidota bacterium]